MAELKAKEYKKFEDIKHTREDGSEFWSARELSDALEYTQWRNFSKVIERAMIACENSGHDVFYDFAEVSKIVDAGATNIIMLAKKYARQLRKLEERCQRTCRNRRKPEASGRTLQYHGRKDGILQFTFEPYYAILPMLGLPGIWY